MTNFWWESKDYASWLFDNYDETFKDAIEYGTEHEVFPIVIWADHSYEERPRRLVTILKHAGKKKDADQDAHGLQIQGQSKKQAERQGGKRSPWRRHNATTEPKHVSKKGSI